MRRGVRQGERDTLACLDGEIRYCGEMLTSQRDVTVQHGLIWTGYGPDSVAVVKTSDPGDCGPYWSRSARSKRMAT